MDTRNTVIKWGIVFCGIAIIVLGLLLPNLADIRQRAQRVNCLGNINAIWKEMSSWGLSPGRTNIFADPSIFVCPCTGHRPGSLTNVFEWTDYVINTNARNCNGDKVIIFCPPINHNNEGGNVIFAAGQGLWVDKEAFDSLIKDGKQYQKE